MSSALTLDPPDRCFDAAGATPCHAAEVSDAVKGYGHGTNEVRALDGVSVEFAAHRFTAIMGPSGSGKPGHPVIRPRPGWS